MVFPSPTLARNVFGSDAAFLLFFTKKSSSPDEARIMSGNRGSTRAIIQRFRRPNRLILVRHGGDCQQTLEGLEIPNVHGCGDRLLHQMIAWDESRVGRAHRRSAFVRLYSLLRKPMAPSHRPIVE